MKYTSVYKFNKPELTDLPDIGILNENFDKIDAAFGNYLPTVGGKMTGKIETSALTVIQKLTDDDELRILGGTDLNSAHLKLFGKNHATYAGQFSLVATDGVNTKYLVANPNGLLTWDGKPLVSETDLTVIIDAANKANEVEVDEATADIEDLQVAVTRLETYPQVIESYRNGTSWYRKWSDGWIEQGGQYIQSTAELTVPLITKFTTTNYHTDFVIHARTYNAVNVISQTTDAINVYSGSNGVNMVVLWKACGY